MKRTGILESVCICCLSIYVKNSGRCCGSKVTKVLAFYFCFTKICFNNKTIFMFIVFYVSFDWVNVYVLLLKTICC